MRPGTSNIGVLRSRIVVVGTVLIALLSTLMALVPSAASAADQSFAQSLEGSGLAAQAGSTPAVSPQVMHVRSCLAGNGRVDTNFVNTGAEAATYRIEFEGLTAREKIVQPSDWWRMPITGRPDGRYTITIKRDGAIISTQDVVVGCDEGRNFVDLDEIRIVNACRADRGYLLFQFVNNRDTRKGYVIEFEDVPNRSTSAAEYGQAVRAVTGRPDGTYSWLVREGSKTVEIGTVNVNCTDQGDPDNNTGPVWGTGNLTASLIDDGMVSLTWPLATDPDGVRAYYVTVPTYAGGLLGVDPADPGLVIPLTDPDGRWDLSEDGSYLFNVFADDTRDASSSVLAGSLSLCAGRQATVVLADGDVTTEGNDVVLGTMGDDSVALAGGDDFACLLGGNDVALGGNGDDRIWLGSGNDEAQGNAGDDRLFGGDGDDLIDGGPGNDSLQGGSGNDGLLGRGGRDTADGGSGNDEILGGADSDTARGGSGNDQIIGESGDDSLQGGDGDDEIFGNAGADSIIGGSGSDTIASGDGDDRVLGGQGSANVEGGAGDDFIDALGGVLIAAGGPGHDTILGGPFDDFLYGGDGDDLVVGNDGGDTIFGGAENGAETFGNDRLSGGAGDDWLFGANGDDELQGGYGADRLTGGTGNDTLFGGADSPDIDIFDGGTGADIYVRPQNGDILGQRDSGDIIDLVSVPAAVGGFAVACDGSSIDGYTKECDTFYPLMQNVPAAGDNEWGHIVYFDCEGSFAVGPSCNTTDMPAAARNFLSNEFGGNTYARFQDSFTTFRGWGMPNPANNPAAATSGTGAETWTAFVFTGSTSYTNRSNSTGLVEYGVDADLSAFAVARDVFRQMIYAIVPAESTVLSTTEGRDLVDGLSTWAALKGTGQQLTCSQPLTCNLSDYNRPYGPGSSGALFFEHLLERSGSHAFITQLLSDVDAIGDVETALIRIYGREYRDSYWSALRASIVSGQIACAAPCELAAGDDGDDDDTLIPPDEPDHRDDNWSVDIGVSYKRKDYTWSDGTEFRTRGYLNPNCVQFKVSCESAIIGTFRPEYTAQAAVLKLFNADYGDVWWLPGTQIDEQLQWEVSAKENSKWFRIDIVEQEQFIYEIKRHTGTGTRAAVEGQIQRYFNGRQVPTFVPGINHLVSPSLSKGTHIGFVLTYHANNEWWVVWAPEDGHIYFDTVESVKNKGLRIQGVDETGFDRYLGQGVVDPIISNAAAIGAAIVMRRGTLPTNVPVGEPILVGAS